MCPDNSTEKHNKTVQTLQLEETIRVKHNVSSSTRRRCIVACVGYNVNESNYASKLLIG